MEYKIDSPERNSEVHPREGSAHQPLVSEAPQRPPPSYSHVIKELENAQINQAAPNASAVTIQPMANSQV